MISIADNPAVTAPRKVLTVPQREALISIEAYRHQNIRSGRWQIGPKHFPQSVIDKLEQLALIRRRGPSSGLDTTMAGQLVIAKLKGETR